MCILFPASEVMFIICKMLNNKYLQVWKWLWNQKIKRRLNKFENKIEKGQTALN